MKKIIIFIAIITCTSLTHAQVNLLLNPSFEKYSTCPYEFNQIQFAFYWSPIDSTGNPDLAGIMPTCSPELIAECADTDRSGGINEGAPYNAYFYHYPRTGKNMAQMEVYDNLYMDSAYDANNPYQRDYMQGRLAHNLVAGVSYCVTFYVAAENANGYAVNHFGAYFDDGSIDAGYADTACISHRMGYYDTCCAQPHTASPPQIVMDSILIDTLGWGAFDTVVFEHRWTKVQGSFIATGTEKFITFGNFSDFEHTDTVQLPPPNPIYDFGVPQMPYSWYLVDDISVVRSDAVADAGPDDTIAHPGDTAWIGNDTAAVGGGDGMPCWWYKMSAGGVVSATAFDSGGRIMVHPDSSTTYVEMMNICGHITYDTVVVRLRSEGVTSPTSVAHEVSVYPNPANSAITISSNENITGIEISNIYGQVLLKQVCNGVKVNLDISGFPTGVYLVKVNGVYVRRVMKE